ncbi:g3441 [Coccomyxa viridis]|uniref:G3441 protein n=1 Tax=Coccomyxa viridis TaxID=1274662 RepID=A0ABP1FQ41_9CHLO
MVVWQWGAVLIFGAMAAVARAEFTFTMTSNVRPAGWTYTAPEGRALTWFSATEYLSPSASLSPVGYLTTPGGQVVDVTQSSAEVTIRGYVPSSDSFSSNETAVELCTATCNLQASCTATAAAPNGPACSLYPLDLAFAGDAVGLITDRDDALLTLVCSEPVEGFCYPDVKQCVYVDGPEAATVIVLAESNKAASMWPSHSLRVSWKASYVGPVIITVDCNLRNQAGMPLVVPTQALEFHVQAHVPVQSGAY